ncbi:MAG: hypothetical protein AB1487_08260 [Thermodesulfobacteriota bacterium]
MKRIRTVSGLEELRGAILKKKARKDHYSDLQHRLPGQKVCEGY